MKLWYLAVRQDLPKNLRDYWGYDCVYAQVIRAPNATRARELASENKGDEGASAWLDPAWTVCEVVTAKGEEGTIIYDFRAG